MSSRKVLVIIPNDTVMEKFKKLNGFFSSVFKNFQLKATSNDEFLEGKLIATFDFAVILNEDNIDEEEFEMQREFLEHYLTCPISASFTTYGTKLPEDLSSKLTQATSIDEDMTGREQEVLVQLAELCSQCSAIQDSMDEGKVKEAFNKFDKDGSGAIDRDELAQVSAELGQPLSEEQLETALEDLDLNKDGVIDFGEFRRWYYSGMKSYSNRKRALFKAIGGFGQFSKAAANPAILEFVKENPQTVTQSVSFGFNPPENAQTKINVQA